MIGKLFKPKNQKKKNLLSDLILFIGVAIATFKIVKKGLFFLIDKYLPEKEIPWDPNRKIDY